MSESREKKLEAALRKIENMAPPCSVEADEISSADPKGAQSSWRDTFRDAQRIARFALKDET